ncbi:hypothetical protein Q9S78_13655 [Microbacterium sp. KSW-18]|uniref:Uncharacterized protein n=1 Tax=Microbacterium aquilitoris TaxID=3067307 RepID=A0ABU3GPB7_9MICO|nr:hypothetical protein [Microbacterium sp. KSW-18]MDT3331711.1 hypothetical protein [Microbacterium sp. KSW-18]
MARVGGRNAAFAWFVGIVSAAIIVTLLVLAIPMFPAASQWLAQIGRTSDGSDGAGAPSPGASSASDAASSPQGCRDLYNDAAWAVLRQTDGAVVTASTDPPVSTAKDVVAALQPAVVLTCRWTSDAGEISTTVATVPTDAGAIAAASLPAKGFTCADDDGRVRCERTDGDLVESIEAGGGRWLSTSQQAWHPSRYAEGVADAVWPAEG